MCTTTGIPILRPLLLPSIVVHSLFCCLITCWLIAALIGESNHCDPSAIRFLPGPYTSGIPWWLPPRQRKCILRSDAGVDVGSRTHFVSAWPASAVTHCYWHKSTSFTHYAARFRMLYMTPSLPQALSLWLSFSVAFVIWSKVTLLSCSWAEIFMPRRGRLPPQNPLTVSICQQRCRLALVHFALWLLCLWLCHAVLPTDWLTGLFGWNVCGK